MTAMTPFPAAAAPSGRMINALLEFADVQEDLGGGRTRMRLSRARLVQPEVRAALGDDVERAAHLAVVYDEREAEVVEVANDLAPPDAFDFTEPSLLWNSYAHARRRRDPSGFGIWR